MPHTTRTQDLREAFSSIITMILGLLRARGLRGLLQLPTLWLVSRELRRMAAEFLILLDAFRAGTLPPAPAPWIDEPQASQAAPAQPPATPRVRARAAACRRTRSEPAPAKPARAGVRARTVPRPSAPIPLGIAAATHRQKNCVLAACFSTPILLRYRNEMDVEKQARGAAPAPARGRAPGPYQWGSKGRCP